MHFSKDLRGMSVLSPTSRVLVVLALLLSVNAPLVHYACGATGETLITSTLAVKTTGMDAVPCGVISEGVHDRLCGESQLSPVCDGDACTIDTIEKQSVVYSQPSSLQVISALSSGALSSEEETSSYSFLLSRSGKDADWSANAPNSLPVRLRTQSFRL